MVIMLVLSRVSISYILNGKPKKPVKLMYA